MSNFDLLFSEENQETQWQNVLKYLESCGEDPEQMIKQAAANLEYYQLHPVNIDDLTEEEISEIVNWIIGEDL
mgnify:CR=1 FL=1